MSEFGIVIIGRNEGERLKNSVRSVIGSGANIVYVDSGSDDGSVEFVRQQHLDVVELDTRIPFSAARARNEGMQWLLEKYPGLDYIQFVDGDCQVSPQWLARACQHLDNNEQLAIVCGRRREQYPEKSTYNLLCDMEWNTPTGLTKSCGGDFMARAAALKEVGGFNPEIVAGEEPDLCYRLRVRGWHIERIDQDMTVHDARILYFSQWWKRTLRSGHAYAHNMVLHWGQAERFNVRNVASILFWGGLIPLLFLLSVLSGSLLLMVVLIVVYGLMAMKIANYLIEERDFDEPESRLYGIYTMIGKVPQMLGVLQFFLKTISTKKFEIIEYKR